LQSVRSKRSIGASLVGLVALIGLAAGARAYAQTSSPLPTNQAVTAPAAAPVARMTTSPGKTTVGNQVSFSASGLVTGGSVDLMWETVQGGWVTRDYYHFEGKKYAETETLLGQFAVGADGVLEGGFTIPEDYGGVHNLVAKLNGTPVAQGAVEVEASFEMSPQEGPVGTPVELRARGMGWQTLESVWVLNWDNVEVGWISSAESKGSAVARFRATGPVGDHRIKVYSGYMGQSYLNFEQAPTAYLPRPEFVFRTTPGGLPPQAYAEPYQPQPIPATASSIGATLALTPSQGIVQSQTQLTGGGFPAGKTLSVLWQTMVGNRVSDTGFAPKETPIGTLDVDGQGKLASTISIPDDLGGLHAVVLKDGEEELARTYFVVETSIVSISATTGPVGTPITIHLKGVGWTEYDNILAANYDNAYMGYACGFNSQGDVVINFTAAGSPGTHLIDLYPSIYKGPGEGQQLYRLPQLTYADDHPGNKIPAFRFAFTVTE
jgi:hypothetical protein